MLFRSDRSACRERFLPALMPEPEISDLSIQRAGQFLRFLSDKHAKAPPHTTGPLGRVHDRYLRIAATLEGWQSELLPNL